MAHLLNQKSLQQKKCKFFVKGVFKEQAVARVKRWFYTCSITQLKRWKSR
jgi:hypothetical protein